MYDLEPTDRDRDRDRPRPRSTDRSRSIAIARSRSIARSRDRRDRDRRARDRSIDRPPRARAAPKGRPPSTRARVDDADHGDEGRAREEHARRAQRERVVHDVVGARHVRDRRRRVRRRAAAGREQVGVRADGVFVVPGACGERIARRRDGANAPRSRRVARRARDASSSSVARRARRRARASADAEGGTRARDRARFTKATRDDETTRIDGARGPAKAATTDGARCARNDAQIASFLWGAVSIRKTERAHAAELTRLRETKTLAELMSLNMGA